MNTETKHKLVDLREEINADRDTAIQEVKIEFLEARENLNKNLKTAIVEIKKDYKQAYVERKVELIVEMNEKAEVQED